MSKLTREEYIEVFQRFKTSCGTPRDLFSFDKLINEHFKCIEDLKNVIKIQKDSLCDNYMIGLYNGLVTAKAIMENTTDYELAKCIDDNKPYELEELEEGMWVWDDSIYEKNYAQIKRIIVHGIGDISVSMKQDEDDDECIGRVFEPNRFYPREVKENGKQHL